MNIKPLIWRRLFWRNGIWRNDTVASLHQHDQQRQQHWLYGVYQIGLAGIQAGIRRSLWVGLLLIATGCESVPNLAKLTEVTPPPFSSPTPDAIPLPTQSPEAATIEGQIHQQINQIRQGEGLATLENNEALAEVARRYSRQMAQQKFFSHVSPEGKTLDQRVRSAGIRYYKVGENLFTSTNIPNPVPTAVEGWMDSPGHRENILTPDYRETGVGVWREGNTYYVTQLFLRSPSFF